MLLELAIGDAYGAGFEYANENVGNLNDLSRYIKHPKHNIIPGYYTDDTQMTLAIAELMVSHAEWTPDRLATKFVEVFKRDPREGYAGGFYHFLQSVENGAEFLERIQPDSDKSGAAMRSVPLGIFPNIETVIEKTTLQAQLTHNTSDGIQAAVAAALTAHYFIYSLGAKQHLGEFLDQHVPGQRWSEPYRGKVKAKGWMSVQAAITAITRNYSMSKLLQDCIAFTGDVDTVATIALGAASQSSEIEPDLPSGLVEMLENGTYGRDYLIALDQQLTNLIQVYREVS